MRRFRNFFFVLYLFSATIFNGFGQPQLKNNLKFGKYMVGFQIFHEYDARRSFLPKYDFNRSLTGFETKRPMQIAVWYPSVSNNKKKSLKYKDYIGLTASEVDFSKQKIHDKTKAVEETLRWMSLDDRKKMDEFYNTDIDVFLNAHQHKGNFPLVLYAPPLDASFYDNSVLCEYLASKGYIVLSTTAKGEYTRLQENSVRSIDAQAEDMAFLLDFGQKFTKSDKIGTIGMSRGGLSNLLFALKNKNIDASISLDGSVFSQGWLDDMRQSLYFHPEDNFSNILMITKNLADPKKNPSTYYDQVKFADKSLIRFDHDKHGYFSALDLVTSILKDHTMSNMEKEKYLSFHVEMIEYCGEFFDAYLKNNYVFKEHPVKKYPHSFDFENAQSKSIAPDLISFWIAEKGIEYVTNIITSIEKKEPGYISKLRWKDLNAIAEEKKQEKKSAEAIKILLLSDQAQPNWYITNYLLGECYKAIGNTTLAIKHYQIALHDNPRHEESIIALKRMNIDHDYHKESIADSMIKNYLGKYEISESNYKEIILKNNELYFISSVASDTMKIWPYSNTLFISDEKDPKQNIQILFSLNNNGQIVSLKTRGMNSGKIGPEFLKISQLPLN